MLPRPKTLNRVSTTTKPLRVTEAPRLEHVSTIPKKPQTPSNATAVQRRAHPTSPCACPNKQAWGSLDSLIGRLRAAYDENGGRPDTNPFAARAIRIYLREVKGSQAKARGITYQKRRRNPTVTTVRLDVD
ncbi:hypothetical protein Bca4012_036573 [Brassica carinata]